MAIACKQSPARAIRYVEAVRMRATRRFKDCHNGSAGVYLMVRTSTMGLFSDIPLLGCLPALTHSGSFNRCSPDWIGSPSRHRGRTLTLCDGPAPEEPLCRAALPGPCNADALRPSIVQFICAAIPGWSLVRLLESFSSRTAICRTGDTALAKPTDARWLNCRHWSEE